MKKPKTYYKVVVENNGNLESACRWRELIDAGLLTIYKLNEWVYPKRGSLFVFNNLEAAKMFIAHEMSSMYKTRVFECHITKPHKVKKLATMWTFKEFWKSKDSHKKIECSRSIPAGTVGCKGVKLLKLVITV